MTCIVFSGPTLSHAGVLALLPHAVCKGPAAQGDILQAVDAGARVICLIDGVFERKAAVAHKELLWALHRGVVVYGASSMGALRAVECERYGMVGYGSVFADFRSGLFEDDDEVTIAHAGADAAYRGGSDAMVNIRATLARANSEGVVSSETQAELVGALKAKFYPNRHLLPFVRERSRVMVSEELTKLTAWLEQRTNWVDVKRADAEGLLRRVASNEVRTNLEAVRWSFPHTAAWEDLVKEHRRDPAPSSAETARPAPPEIFTADGLTWLVEEVQLAGPVAFSQIMLAASWRATALALDASAGERAGNFASEDAQIRSTDSDAVVTRRATQTMSAIKAQVPHVLRMQGDLSRVWERACAKQDVLARTTAREVHGDPFKWYFESRLRQAVPTDLGAFAHSIGVASARALRELLIREQLFLKAVNS